jgi:hypothetical protein
MRVCRVEYIVLVGLGGLGYQSLHSFSSSFLGGFFSSYYYYHFYRRIAFLWIPIFWKLN